MRVSQVVIISLAFFATAQSKIHDELVLPTEKSCLINYVSGVDNDNVFPLSNDTDFIGFDDNNRDSGNLTAKTIPVYICQTKVAVYLGPLDLDLTLEKFGSTRSHIGKMNNDDPILKHMKDSYSSIIDSLDSEYQAKMTRYPDSHINTVYNEDQILKIVRDANLFMVDHLKPEDQAKMTRYPDSHIETVYSEDQILKIVRDANLFMVDHLKPENQAKMTRYPDSHIETVYNEDHIMKIARDANLFMVDHLKPEDIEQMTRYSDLYKDTLSNDIK